MVALFISHAEADKPLVRSFVHLLEAAFRFKPEDLRCTSLHPYSIPLGKDPIEVLKNDFEVLKLFLPFFTHNSQRSAWVNAEIGAAWIKSLKSIPLLFGLNWKDIRGPLYGHSTPAELSVDGLHRLFEDIHKSTTWKKKTAPGDHNWNTFVGSLNDFCNLAKNSQVHFDKERLLFRSDLKVNKLDWEDIANAAKREVFIWGWSCINTVSNNSRPHFKKLLDKVDCLSFLTLNPDVVSKSSVHLNFGPVCDKYTRDIRADVDLSYSNLKATLLDQIASSLQDKVEIRNTDWFMSWAGVAIDPKEVDGIIQVEFFHYNDPIKKQLDSRPNLVLTKQSQFFDVFWNSFDAMYKAAKIVKERSNN
ncbi:MAG: toll/interleukin-1 receptor domain-containing protein [Rhizobiales bacterium]|nr:toll/interleukin-1 receptor domain-containing protein [Hyphomicrobiales bacterium]MBI3673574.1 toll/interleukin-1 receptor domain-containing protein [Hyphomicrobiales bacterium]